MPLDHQFYVDQLLADTTRFAAAVRLGPLDAPVAACPGWDVRALTEHMGHVQRWARLCLLTAENPQVEAFVRPLPTAPADEWAAWLEQGAVRLADTLRAADPNAPTWHPFPVERVAGVWPRRQAQELSVHRWDVERAVGRATPISPEMAADGIDEFFEVAFPRAQTRQQATPPAGSFHVHCTDTHGEWLAWHDADGYRFVREHAKGDAALRGPAHDLLLALYHREHDASALSPVGDEAVLAGWLGAPGL